MPQCSFCQEQYEIPRGLTYVLTEGTILHFCSSKCFKNYKIGRKSKKLNWIRKSDVVKKELKKKGKYISEQSG